MAFWVPLMIGASVAATAVGGYFLHKESTEKADEQARQREEAERARDEGRRDRDDDRGERRSRRDRDRDDDKDDGIKDLEKEIKELKELIKNGAVGAGAGAAAGAAAAQTPMQQVLSMLGLSVDPSANLRVPTVDQALSGLSDAQKNQSIGQLLNDTEARQQFLNSLPPDQRAKVDSALTQLATDPKFADLREKPVSELKGVLGEIVERQHGVKINSPVPPIPPGPSGDIPAPQPAIDTAEVPAHIRGSVSATQQPDGGYTVGVSDATGQTKESSVQITTVNGIKMASFNLEGGAIEAGDFDGKDRIVTVTLQNANGTAMTPEQEKAAIEQAAEQRLAQWNQEQVTTYVRSYANDNDTPQAPAQMQETTVAPSPADATMTPEMQQAVAGLSGAAIVTPQADTPTQQQPADTDISQAVAGLSGITAGQPETAQTPPVSIEQASTGLSGVVDGNAVPPVPTTSSVEEATAGITTNVGSGQEAAEVTTQAVPNEAPREPGQAPGR